MTTGAMVRSAKQAALIVLACMSLVVSSFGACICPHHEAEIEKPALSCHSTSHEARSAEPVPNANKAEVPCVCTREVSPVVLNKSERKKSVDQKDPSAPVEITLTESAAAAFVATVRPLITDTGPDLYTTFYSRSAPSRAPPRL